MKPTSKTVNKKRATCLQHCRKKSWILRCCVFYHRGSNKVARFFCRGWQKAQHRYSTRFAAIPFFVARFTVPLDLLIFYFFSFSLPLPFSITHFYVFVWVNYTTTILTRAALLALSKSIYHEIALNLKPGPHESRHFETAYYVTRIRVDRTWKLYNHIPVRVPLKSRSHSRRILNHVHYGQRFQKDKRCSLGERFYRFGVCERSIRIWKIRLKNTQISVEVAEVE